MASLTDVVVSGVVGIGGSLAAAEIVAHAPAITNWLIHRAESTLPEEDRARYSEEWRAHANELPGAFSKLRHGLGCYLRAARSIKNFRSRPMWRRHVEASYWLLRLWLRLFFLGKHSIVQVALSRGWRTAFLLSVMANLVIKTVITERVYRDGDRQQVTAATTALFKQIEEAIAEARPATER